MQKAKAKVAEAKEKTKELVKSGAPPKAIKKAESKVKAAKKKVAVAKQKK